MKVITKLSILFILLLLKFYIFIGIFLLLLL
nr:MAG TPA: hypothetical protein [Caudoviricetes sp.]